MERNKKGAIADVMAESINLDILAEILSRLRVKDVLRIKCVCKAWLRLISSKEFAKLYVEKSKSEPSRIKYLPNGSLFVPCPRLFPREHYNDNYHRPNDKSDMVCVGSSCDGLICLFNEYYAVVHIRNPATRVSACIPIKKPYPRDSARRISCFWFGRHNNEYKLILGTQSTDYFNPDPGVEGFSHMHLIRPYVDKNTGYKSTREFKERYGFNKEMGTLCNGDYVHWVVASDEKYSILTYNLREETVGNIPAPPNESRFLDEDRSLVIGESRNGCLSAMYYSTMYYEGEMYSTHEVWEMRDYGVGESWTKVMVFGWDYYKAFHNPSLLDHEKVKSPIFEDDVYFESLVNPRLVGDNDQRKACCCCDSYCCIGIIK